MIAWKPAPSSIRGENSASSKISEVVFRFAGASAGIVFPSLMVRDFDSVLLKLFDNIYRRYYQYYGFE